MLKIKERERDEDSVKTFVSKSWPGQQGLGRPFVGTGQSVKGVSEAGGLLGKQRERVGEHSTRLEDQRSR